MTGDAADKVIEQISKDRNLTEAEEQEARIQAVTSLALMVGVIQVKDAKCLFTFFFLSYLATLLH